MPGSESPQMREQGVDQGAVFVAWGGMDDQSSRFVEDDEVGVLVQDGQVNGLSGGCGGYEGGCGQGVTDAGPHKVGRVEVRVAVACGEAFVDQGLDASAG